MQDAVTQPDALLIERILDDTFGLSGASGQGVFDEVARAYAEALCSSPVTPPKIDLMLA